MRFRERNIGALSPNEENPGGASSAMRWINQTSEGTQGTDRSRHPRRAQAPAIVGSTSTVTTSLVDVNFSTMGCGLVFAPPRPTPGPRPERMTPVPDATSAADLQQKYRQFLDLMPMTVALAGLPPSEHRLFSEEQLEARAITMRLAYKVARNVAKECLGGS